MTNALERLRSLGKSREIQKSSLISKEKVNKALRSSGHLLSGCWKWGVEFKGGSLHDGFGGSGEHLALLLACPRNYSANRKS